MRYEFIEIGTSDFNYLAGGKGPGISVEPIQKYLNRIPSKGTTKVNAAIIPLSEKRPGATATIWYISEAEIERLKLPAWAKGCASVNKPHETIKNRYPEAKWTTEEIPAMTLGELYKKYGVTEIGTLKIDAEGRDTEIVLQHLKLDVLANKIEFEVNALTDPMEVKAIEEALRLTTCKMDRIKRGIRISLS